MNQEVVGSPVVVAKGELRVTGGIRWQSDAIKRHRKRKGSVRMQVS